MKELLEKISSYNLANFLLPGALFAVAAEQITVYHFTRPSLLATLVIYYFAGMVISRLGSLLLDPIGRRTKFLTSCPYTDFALASKSDDKLVLISEINNMYRTLCMAFLALPLLKLYEFAITRLGIPSSATPYVTDTALFLLFAFAFRKQTHYLVQRVKAVNQ